MMHYKKYAILFFLAVLVFSCSKSEQPTDTPFDGKTYSNQSVGKSAHDLLAATQFTSIKIEIQYTPGYKPADGVVTQVENFLKARLNKPDGILITETQIPSVGKDQISRDGVISIEDQFRTQYATRKEISLYILIADANYTDHSVLGFTYRNTSICLLGKQFMTIRGVSDRLTGHSF